MNLTNLLDLFTKLDEIIQHAKTPESGKRIYFRRTANHLDNGDESGIYTNFYERNEHSHNIFNPTEDDETQMTELMDADGALEDTLRNLITTFMSADDIYQEMGRNGIEHGNNHDSLILQFTDHCILLILIHSGQY